MTVISINKIITTWLITCVHCCLDTCNTKVELLGYHNKRVPHWSTLYISFSIYKNSKSNLNNKVKCYISSLISCKN